MNRFAALVALAFWPALSFAQPPAKITKVIRLHYVLPQKVADLLNPGGSVMVVGDNLLKAVVLKGEASNVASAEQTIKELDVPQASDSGRDIEVTVYVLGATNKSQSAVTTPTATPRSLEPVIKQLQAIFPYGSYQLLDSMLVHSREGRQTTSTTGMMKSFAGAPDSFAKMYSITYDAAANPAEGNQRAIRFEKFEFYTSEKDVGHIGFTTDFDVHEAQKVVVGKTNVDGGESALFVVLTARVLE